MWGVHPNGEESPLASGAVRGVDLFLFYMETIKREEEKKREERRKKKARKKRSTGLPKREGAATPPQAAARFPSETYRYTFPPPRARNNTRNK